MNYRVRDASGENLVSFFAMREGPDGWRQFEWAVDGGKRRPGRARREGDEIVFESGGLRHRVFVGPLRDGGPSGGVEVVMGPETYRFQVLRGQGAKGPRAAGAPAEPRPVSTPMPGRVLAVHVKLGQAVRRGDLLVTLEAMKMQNEFLAPMAGRVHEVRVSAGDVARAGDVLVVIEPGARSAPE
jgi:glutaconyl-CoA decarboxylase